MLGATICLFLYKCSVMSTNQTSKLTSFRLLMLGREGVGLREAATAVYSLLLIIGVIFSNSLFSSFIASKPDGRKTSLGE